MRERDTNVALPVLFGCLILALPSKGQSEVLLADSREITGMVCVKAAPADLHKVLYTLRNAGISARKGDADRDSHCHSSGYAISFPEGLERIVIQKLTDVGIPAETTYAATDGPIVLIDDSELSPTPVSDETLGEAKSQMECKLRTVALENFKTVSFRPCAGPAFPGLCWDMSLLGHAASSPGLRPARIKAMIPDKHWVKISLEVWMGRFESLFSQDHREHSDKVLVYLATSSEFAPGAESRLPADNQFNTIDAFESDEEKIDRLDDEISLSLAKTFFSTKLKCAKPE
ncbi:hypothetical protein GOB57_07745 [Sinorhizobium meliloti]|nr:hypothetical protein [Sinorhizobium meliloti]